MQNFVLVLHGPPEGGQAKIASQLLRGQINRFHVSVNKIKFLISDYSAEKTDRHMVNRMLFALAVSARQEHHSLVVEGSSAILSLWRVPYSDLAKQTGAAFVEVNIEAPYPTLVERFNERVTRSMTEGKQISIWEEADLKQRYDSYQCFKNRDLPTFDSSVLDGPKIVEEIEKLLA